MTPWQVGRDYERYVGYLREQAGCAVAYHGIVKGFEDLGRDVLAEKDGTIEVIRCKRWAQHKEIREKHTFNSSRRWSQHESRIPGKEVVGTFTATTALSERAREFARVLEIKVEENVPLRLSAHEVQHRAPDWRAQTSRSDYPRIKCNIAHRTGERIYHLPLDQQYDTTVVEPTRGERYVATAVEADELGFRRAWRWRGEATVP
jgi:hypothetical protein